jgi:uncharacterized YigZ family protein
MTDTLIDSYSTIAGEATGEFKDRGSQFIGYAWPVSNEAEALSCIAALKKEHLKARHHCFAWRLGTNGTRFRTNDDNEPTGTAGRPILGQIDSLNLTDVCVVVVRYFGGTLLGTSGLIQAYRTAAAAALSAAQIKEVILTSPVDVEVDYTCHAEVVNALNKLQIDYTEEGFEVQHAIIRLAIRQSQVTDTLLRLKSALWKTTPAEAVTLDWPQGVRLMEEQ